MVFSISNFNHPRQIASIYFSSYSYINELRGFRDDSTTKKGTVIGITQPPPHKYSAPNVLFLRRFRNSDYPVSHNILKIFAK